MIIIRWMGKENVEYVFRDASVVKYFPGKPEKQSVHLLNLCKCALIVVAPCGDRGSSEPAG